MISITIIIWKRAQGENFPQCDTIGPDITVRCNCSGHQGLRGHPAGWKFIRSKSVNVNYNSKYQNVKKFCDLVIITTKRKGFKQKLLQGVPLILTCLKCSYFKLRVTSFMSYLAVPSSTPDDNPKSDNFAVQDQCQLHFMATVPKNLDPFTFTNSFRCL